MAKREIIRIISVDRGIINVGTCNEGKHIPYYAGLLVLNQTDNTLEFLDTYNSEILLRTMFHYENTPDPSPSLHTIIVENRDFMARHLPLITVPDLEAYLKMDRVITLPRNSARMKMMAQRIEVLTF